jgi:hypothetical protein
MRPDLFENMTMIELSLPIHDDGSDLERRAALHGARLDRQGPQARQHRTAERQRPDGAWVRAVAFVPND